MWQLWVRSRVEVIGLILGPESINVSVSNTWKLSIQHVCEEGLVRPPDGL